MTTLINETNATADMATFATAYMATYNATAYMANQFSLSLLAAHHIEISCCGYSYWQSKLFIIKKTKEVSLKTLQPLSYCVGVFSEVLF